MPSSTWLDKLLAGVGFSILSGDADDGTGTATVTAHEVLNTARTKFQPWTDFSDPVFSTGAAQVTLYSKDISIPDGVSNFEFVVLATDGTDSATWKKSMAVHEPIATIVIIGPVPADETTSICSSGAATWTSLVDFSTNTLVVHGTGQAAKNITWAVAVQSLPLVK